MSEVPALYERRCPQCGAPGAYTGADTCATCDVALQSVAVRGDAGEAPRVFVYRPWVPWVMAAVAVAFPFLPIPFLGGIPGIALKLCVTAAIIRAIRDYKEGMR